MYMCRWIYIYIHIYIYIYINTHVDKCIYIYTYICKWIYIYKYTYLGNRARLDWDWTRLNMHQLWLWRYSGETDFLETIFLHPLQLVWSCIRCSAHTWAVDAYHIFSDLLDLQDGHVSLWDIRASPHVSVVSWPQEQLFLVVSAILGPRHFLSNLWKIMGFMGGKGYHDISWALIDVTVSWFAASHVHIDDCATIVQWYTFGN